MNLIDDIDFIFSLIGFESSLFDQVSDIFDTIIARTIDLDTVEHRTHIEGPAILTCVTGIPILEVCTIHSLREDTSTRRLACSTRSMKEVSMIDSISSETIPEDRRNVVLAYDGIPIMWTVGCIERHSMADRL